MLNNQVIILFRTFYWDKNSVYESQTAKNLAKRNKVFVLNFSTVYPLWQIVLIRKLRKIFWAHLSSLNHKLSFVPNFYFLPFNRLPLIAKINQFISLKISQLIILGYCELNNKKPILWLFFPKHHSFIGKYFEFLALYDCLDQPASLNLMEDKKQKSDEKKLLEKVNIVFTNSPSLFRLKKALHPKVYLVPQGYNAKLFLKYPPKNDFLSLKHIARPIIGFTGNICHRLDFKLIKSLAGKNQNWSFVFVGPTNLDSIQDKIAKTTHHLKELKRIKNVYFFGQQSQKKLINFMVNFDIAMIPYNLQEEFNRYCFPVKTFEYFSLGKPIIATPIESLLPLRPYLLIAKNANAFSPKIKQILGNGWPKNYIREQKEIALKNSWQKKLAAISQYLKINFPEVKFT